jgi:hypothetical protein
LTEADRRQNSVQDTGGTMLLFPRTFQQESIMTNHDLGAAIQQAALDFSAAIVRAIRASSLQELLEMGAGGGKAAAKPGRVKPGPTGKKRGRPAKAAKKGKAPAKKAKAPAKKAKAPAKKGKKRLSGEEKRAVLDAIVAYLVKHPASKGPAVAAALGLETIRAGVYLKELRAAKRVTAKGEKVKMVYSAAAKRKRVAKMAVSVDVPASTAVPMEPPPVDLTTPVDAQ